MSQYPSPYFPPNIQPSYMPYAEPGDVLAPARRAGVLMFVIGGLLLLISVCDFLQYLTSPMDEQLQHYHEIQSMQHGPTLEMGDQLFKILIVTVPVLLGITGIIFIALAIGIRQGNRASTIATTVLSTIGILGLGLFVLLLAIAGLEMPVAFLLALLLLIPLGVMIRLMIWLVGAMRALPYLANAQQQYMAQYWHYQQQMQAYAGYGYGAVPISQQPPAPDVPASGTPGEG